MAIGLPFGRKFKYTAMGWFCGYRTVRFKRGACKADWHYQKNTFGVHISGAIPRKASQYWVRHVTVYFIVAKSVTPEHREVIEWTFAIYQYIR